MVFLRGLDGSLSNTFWNIDNFLWHRTIQERGQSTCALGTSIVAQGERNGCILWHLRGLRALAVLEGSSILSEAAGVVGHMREKRPHGVFLRLREVTGAAPGGVGIDGQGPAGGADKPQHTAQPADLCNTLMRSDSTDYPVIHLLLVMALEYSHFIYEETKGPED